MNVLGVALAAMLMIAWLQPVSTGSVLQNTTPVATLEGTVFDPSGSVIPLSLGHIVIENVKTGQVWRIHPDEESGKYSATLPPGTYRLTSQSTMYLPFRRADFQLKSGSNPIVNLVLFPEYSIRGTTVGREKVDELGPKPRYESVTIPGAPADISSLLIRHFGKRTAKGKTVYEQAALTLDLLTVNADTITFDRAALRFNAKGRVVVDDGKERRDLPAASIYFRDGKAIFEPEVPPE